MAQHRYAVLLMSRDSPEFITTHNIKMFVSLFRHGKSQRQPKKQKKNKWIDTAVCTVAAFGTASDAFIRSESLSNRAGKAFGRSNDNFFGE